MCKPVAKQEINFILQLRKANDACLILKAVYHPGCRFFTKYPGRWIKPPIIKQKYSQSEHAEYNASLSSKFFGRHY
jgi:hypothetical protein